jgi:hypothetical protein
LHAKLTEISSLPYMTTRIMLINTKRLGRYHYPTNNNNNDNSTSPSYFNELASLYKDNSRRSLHDWDKPLFGSKRTSLQKVLANANKTLEKSTKFINKIKSRQLAYANRAKSIPENATIRKEYIKCGKEICEQKHGPYYYAYWKDPESKKLKKKYIGDHMPKDKELDNDYCNDNNTL